MKLDRTHAMQPVTYPSPHPSPHAKRRPYAVQTPTLEEGALTTPGDILQLPLSTSKSLTEA